MKKILMSVAMTLVVLTAAAEKQTVRLYIEDMECKNCQAKVENTLGFERGVKKLEVELDKRQVLVTFDDKKTSVEKLQAALMKYNKYPSQVITECEQPSQDMAPCCKKH